MKTPSPFVPLVASTGRIRSQFPALAREHQGRPVAFFDGPGGTQVPRLVVEAMTDYLYQHNANTHWAFPTSRETDQAIAEARQTLADFLNATRGEVAFGANMTTLTLHLARSLGRGFGPGDEVVVTELDHHANVDPWREMARERGLFASHGDFYASTVVERLGRAREGMVRIGLACYTIDDEIDRLKGALREIARG